MNKVQEEPARFGKYLLLERIGQGGMSEVFLAKSTGIEGFERRLALKRIFPTLAANPEFVEGFIHEARIGGMLYHHNVVQTLDFGRCDDTLYIALEYVEGTNLGAVLARCRRDGVQIPPPVFLQVALQICEGLEYIHNASSGEGKLDLVHRDIKPSNMLITAQGLVKISDFGVVKAGERTSGTAVGALKGTVGYMSPEQARGEAVGPTSDIYSLGAMLFEMATFQRLYGEGDLLAVLQRVKTCAFQVPIEAAAAYIPGLERVLRRMLASEPSERYASASEVSAALRALPVRVADRKAVVAFVDSLGLLSGTASTGSGGEHQDPEEAPTERPSPPASSDSEPAAGSGPVAVRDRTRWITFGWLALFVLVGVVAAAGTYHLVQAHFETRGSGRGALDLGDRCHDTAVEVLVRSVPPGASLSVDGQALPAHTPLRLRACPGQAIELSLPGYLPWHGTLDPAAGAELTARLELEQLTPRRATDR